MFLTMHDSATLTTDAIKHDDIGEVALFKWEASVSAGYTDATSLTNLHLFGVAYAGMEPPDLIAEYEATYVPLWGTLTDDEKRIMLLLGVSPDGTPQAEIDTLSEGTLFSLKLHRWLDGNETRDHRTVNYLTELTGRLDKRIVDMFRGEVRTVEYHSDPDKDDLVLKVEVAYNRTANGLATDRTTTRTWYDEAGAPSPAVKVTGKKYDALHQMREGRRRRDNVIDSLKLSILTLLTMTETAGDIAAAEVIGITYLAKYGDQIDLYLGTGDLSWKTPPASPNITDDTETWLGNLVDALGLGYPAGWTIRDVLLDSLQAITDP